MNRTSIRTLAAASAVVGLVACGGTPPSLLSIGNRQVTAGERLEFVVAATDPDSSELVFSAELMPAAASLETFAATQARFSWTTTAADEGEHQVDFFVSDGRSRDSERVTITVLPGGDATGPEFLTATSWFIEEGQKSLEKIVEVRDDSATALTWQIDGAPEGATFSPLFKKAVFFWEPTAAQQQIPQHSFTITVTNEATHRSASEVFTVIIRDGGSTTCTGDKPSVSSTTPDSLEGTSDFTVTANASDPDSAIRSASLRWATGDDPQPSDFVTVPMSPGSGSAWSGVVQLEPALAAGEFRTVTFDVCARDDDDPEGDACDHEACTPRRSFMARAPSGGGLCSACENDDQCGSEADFCLVNASGTETFCGRDCAATGACPEGYACYDIGDAGVKQCAPDNAGITCNPSGFRRAAPGELVLNEILADPPAGSDANGDGTDSNTADEFIEIVSLAAGSVDVGNFTISDEVQVRFTIPGGAVLGPGEALLVFGGGDPTRYGDLGGAKVYAAAESATTGLLGLNNAGDQVQVRDPDFNLIVGATYGGEGGADQSLTLEPQVTGFNFVKHAVAPGANGAALSPGLQSCGKAFPIAVHGGCGGSTCGAGADTDREPNDDRPQAACIAAIPAYVAGTLAYHGGADKPGPDPVDYYVFSAEAGQRLLIATLPGVDPDVEDTTLKVLDATGSLLAENDDALGPDGQPSTLYSEIPAFLVPATGTYYLAVGTYQGQSDRVGSYELAIEMADE